MAIDSTHSLTTNYFYNTLGQLEKVVVGDDPDGNGPKVAPQTTYEYDGVGNRTKETVAIDSTHSLTTNYFYNTLGQLEKVVVGDDPTGTDRRWLLRPRTSTTVWETGRRRRWRSTPRIL